MVYLTESLLPAALLAGLAARGVATEASLDSGQLQVRTAEETHLAGGRFDPVATIDLLSSHIDLARNDGWAGLRLVGDMAWALCPVPEVEHLGWYEAQVNPLCVSGGALAICRYDRRLFSGGELLLATSAHTSSTFIRAGRRWAQLLRIRRVVDPPGLRLIGEADLSNRRALATVLSDLTKDPPEREQPVVIDVSELAFADGAAASLIVRAAEASPNGVRIVGCSRSLARLLDMVAPTTFRLRDVGPTRVWTPRREATATIIQAWAASAAECRSRRPW